MWIAFDSPGYLWLLVVAPLIWWLSFRGLSGLGTFRRLAALTLRTSVLVLLVLALAEAHWVQANSRLTVLYLLDQSRSIPELVRRQMPEYVNASVAEQRNSLRHDRAGVIVFGREAAIEYPPTEHELRIRPTADATVDTDYTNLAAALKLALATLSDDTAARVVVLTDGNENIGQALEQARALADRGIGIDVAPLRYVGAADVAVEKVVVPADVRRGQAFEVRVVLHNSALDADAAPIAGRLRLTRKTGDGEQLLAEQPISVAPGKRVFALRDTIHTPDFFTYDARFVPDAPDQDQVPQNDRATAFVNVRGQGRVLLIEDADNPGEFDGLVERLREQDLQVSVLSTNVLFATPGELQPYDAVILANVPREAFSEAQIGMLAANTRQMGAGLLMLGGPNSFGAGGWAGTDVEAAMPIDFRVDNAKVVAVGALALVIDRSGSMVGENIAMAKAAAAGAVDILSPRDFVTVVTFDTTARLVVPLTRNDQPRAIKARIDRIDADGGTNLEPGILLAYRQLAGAKEAALRHMIILSDGYTSGSNYNQIVQQLRRDGITVSTVAVGSDADVQLLNRLATIGGGRFYHANSPRALPRIFQREARVVSRPVIYERAEGIASQPRVPNEMTKGLDGRFPPVTGYVMSTRKSNPLVEVPLVASEPGEEINRTLLAGWTYGLGKSVALTTDAGRRWATDWTAWNGYDKLFGQMVRWSMRPSGDEGRFSVATNVKDGRAQVVVTALDADDGFLNFLELTGNVTRPDLKPMPLELRQVAPGRYVGEFDAHEAGSYFLGISAGPNMAPILAGLNVPYSSEFLDRQANEGLLASLAALAPRGGQPGRLIESRPDAGLTGLLQTDVFRHDLQPSVSRREAWPSLIFVAGCLFFADVLVRRVQMGLGWLRRGLAWIRDRLLRRTTTVETEYIGRLRSRKAEVVAALDARRAAVRFEPDAAAEPVATEELLAAGGPPAPPQTAPAKKAEPSLSPEAEQESYTSRLLKAKQKVWQHHPNRHPKNDD